MVITALLLTYIVWRFYKVVGEKEDYLNEINQQKYINGQLLAELESLKQYFLFQNILIPKTVTNNIILNIRKDETYIIACFSEENCGTCIKRLIIDLIAFKERNNFSKVMLIGNIPTNKFHQKMKIEKDVFEYIYFSELMNLENTYKQYPFLFCINYKNEISNLFIPDLLKEYNEKYFFELLPAYLNSLN